MPHALRSPVVVILLVGVLGLLAMGVAQPGRAQTPPAASPPIPVLGGRYQMVGIGSNNGYVIVIDTQTGHCWSKFVYQSGGSWNDLGSPVPAQ